MKKEIEDQATEDRLINKNSPLHLTQPCSCTNILNTLAKALHYVSFCSGIDSTVSISSYLLFYFYFCFHFHTHLPTSLHFERFITKYSINIYKSRIKSKFMLSIFETVKKPVAILFFLFLISDEKQKLTS